MLLRNFLMAGKHTAYCYTVLNSVTPVVTETVIILTITGLT